MSLKCLCLWWKQSLNSDANLFRRSSIKAHAGRGGGGWGQSAGGWEMEADIRPRGQGGRVEVARKDKGTNKGGPIRAQCRCWHGFHADAHLNCSIGAKLEFKMAYPACFLEARLETRWHHFLSFLGQLRGGGPHMGRGCLKDWAQADFDTRAWTKSWQLLINPPMHPL